MTELMKAISFLIPLIWQIWSASSPQRIRLAPLDKLLQRQAPVTQVRLRLFGQLPERLLVALRNEQRLSGKFFGVP